ncbi:hypothetical protein [Mycobacteroides abscessus]|uniref:hypothetical protein n=1 Tax=Mycobacteroides abscessus TaxID=36809 RepID=UPI00094188A4|nr:hypothetical protein [Mycobacteroides abscessus]
MNAVNEARVREIVREELAAGPVSGVELLCAEGFPTEAHHRLLDDARVHPERYDNLVRIMSRRIFRDGNRGYRYDRGADVPTAAQIEELGREDSVRARVREMLLRRPDAFDSGFETNHRPGQRIEDFPDLLEAVGAALGDGGDFIAQGTADWQAGQVHGADVRQGFDPTRSPSPGVQVPPAGEFVRQHRHDPQQRRGAELIANASTKKLRDRPYVAGHGSEIVKKQFSDLGVSQIVCAVARWFRCRFHSSSPWSVGSAPSVGELASSEDVFRTVPGEAKPESGLR